MSELVDLGVVDKRLGGITRPASPGVTSGLARALAERLDFDVLLVRVVLVFLTIFTGLGLAIYAWGTLLTPRLGHEPPITRFAPGFAALSRTTQIVIMAGSSVLVGLIWGAGSAGTGIAIALAATLAWLLISRRTPTPDAESADAAATMGRPPAEPTPSETYEQWQARMRGAVEPYPSRITIKEPTPAPLAPRTSWWGGLGVLGLGAAAAAAPVLLGILDPVVISAAGAGAMGLALLLWTLLFRTRRVPGLVLGIGLALAAGTAVLMGVSP